LCSPIKIKQNKITIVNEIFINMVSGQLRVLAFAPTFAKYPLEEKTFAAEGGNVTLKCNPEGAPIPDFVW